MNQKFNQIENGKIPEEREIKEKEVIEKWS